MLERMILYVPMVLQDFGCHVEWRSAQCFRQRGGLQVPGKSKIGNLERKPHVGVVVNASTEIVAALAGNRWVFREFLQGQRPRQEQILRLDVSVNQFLSPQKAQTTRQIPHQPACQAFRETTLLPGSNEVLYVSAPAVFQYQIEMSVGFLYIVHANNVWMAVGSHNGYFYF